VVTNGGIFEPKPFAEIPSGLVRLFFEKMYEREGGSRDTYLAGMFEAELGRILFMSSEGRCRFRRKWCTYGMSKGAQIAWRAGSQSRCAGNRRNE